MEYFITAREWMHGHTHTLAPTPIVNTVPQHLCRIRVSVLFICWSKNMLSLKQPNYLYIRKEHDKLRDRMQHKMKITTYRYPWV